MAKCGESVGRDMNGKAVRVCDYVEISPHIDLWMRGARTGVDKSHNKDGTISVRMDNRRVRKLQRMHPADVKRL